MFLFDYEPDPEIVLEPPRPAPGVKPNYPVEIDWSHPLARGLIHGWLVGTASLEADLVTGTFYEVTDRTLTTQEPEYLGTIFNTSSKIKFPISIDTFDGFSVSCGNLRTSGTVNWSCLRTDTGIWTGIYQEGGTLKSANNNTFDGATTPTQGTRRGSYDNAVVAVESGRLAASINGGPVATDSSFTLPVYTSAVDGIYVGGSQQSTFGNLSNTLIGYCFVWSRALSDTEILSVSKDPYQFLRPKHNIISLPYQRTSDDNLDIPDPKFEMPELWIPGRKPTGPVNIDWDNPLAKDLTVFATFEDTTNDGCRNLADPGAPGVYGGTPATISGNVVRPWGRGVLFHPLGGANGYDYVAFSDKAMTSTDVTFYADVYKLGAGGARLWNWGNGTDCFRILPEWSGSNTILVSYIDSSPAQIDCTLTTGTSPLTSNRIRVIARKRGSTITCWARINDGPIEKATPVTGGNGGLRDATSEDMSPTGYAGHYEMFSALAYNRALSDVEMESLLISSPYAFLIPK